VLEGAAPEHLAAYWLVIGTLQVEAMLRPVAERQALQALRAKMSVGARRLAPEARSASLAARMSQSSCKR
jgi:hypothetical protein